MSLLWVARQPPPGLNNQQLPPASPARARGRAGPGRRGRAPVGAAGSSPAPPATPIPAAASGKQEFPQKPPENQAPCALPGPRRRGWTLVLPAGRGCDATPHGRRPRFPCPHPVPSWGAQPRLAPQRPPRASVSPGERCPYGPFADGPSPVGVNGGSQRSPAAGPLPSALPPYSPEFLFSFIF